MQCLICESPKNIRFNSEYKYDVQEDKKYLSDIKLYRCEECDFTFAHPMPSMNVLNDYYENFYRTPDRPPYFLTGNIEDLKKECFADRNFNYLLYLTTFLDFSKIKSIYDFGAGNGDVGYLLKKKFPHLKLYCTESDKHCKEILNERGYKNFTNIDEIDEKFDLIISFHSLEHLSDTKIFSFFKNTLSQNGHIFYEVPNTEKKYFETRDSDSPHLCFYTKKAFEKINEIYGLKFVNFSYSYYTFEYDAKVSKDARLGYEKLKNSSLPLLKIKQFLRKILPDKLIQFRRDLNKIKSINSEDRINNFINNSGNNCYIRGLVTPK